MSGTKTQHTPGTWTTRRVSSAFSLGTRDLVNVGVLQDGAFWTVAELVSADDAPIISAAPEMLEALKECHELLAGLHGQAYPKCKGGCPDHYALDMARDAIAKAEGGGE